MQRPVLSASFRLAHKTLLFPRAKLYDDRMELTGWSLQGRYSLVVALSHVERVEWWPGRVEANLAIFLKERRPIELSMRGAGNWKYAIDERLSARTPLRPPLPDDQSQPEKRSAAA